ncbi:hypothetical protein [Acinetobacter haemolyticus]|uniref:hypothetical protein n=1 Tax=Acinetobacter haemolyticus TaxID=29430 RepID=UPI001D1838D9|nr:hypothetical protein [Acinetobacter haemolyticus]
MAVPEQTPFIEYIANGSTTHFSLDFDCDKQDYLIVTLDDNEPPVGSWSLSAGFVVFLNAPSDGVKVEIKRNTPFERTVDYQSYNNSFRPPAVNKDFDLIWWKLQELGVADWILGNGLKQEILNRIAADEQMLDYILNQDNALKADYIERDSKLKDYIDQMIALVTGDPLFQGIQADFVLDGDKTQKEINEKTMFLSEYINNLNVFFLTTDKNRVVDIPELPVEDTIQFSGSLDFSNLQIKAAGDFSEEKKPVMKFLDFSVAKNITIDGRGFNVRGVSLNASGVSIDNLTVKNTKYLAVEGIEDFEKLGNRLNNINIENVCTSGVAGDFGYGGISFERSIGGTFDNITMKNVGAKGFRLRYSKDNSGYKHIYDDIKNQQTAIYLASGENNNIDDVSITNTRNMIKMSRGEKKSKISTIRGDNSHIIDSVFTVGFLLQGTYDCELIDIFHKKGNGFGIRVEPHPAEAGDPDAEQRSLNNKISKVVMDSVGTGNMLYSVRSSSLLQMSGNEFSEIKLIGNDLATSGVTLQRSEKTKVSNVDVLSINGTDLAISDSDVDFNGGSLVSSNSTAARKITISGVSDVSFFGTKMKGQTTNGRYLSFDSSGGRLQLINCKDVETISSDVGIYLAGAAATVNLINTNQKGNRVVVANNLMNGAIVNNLTENPISNSSANIIFSNNVTASTTSKILKNQLLGASTIAVGSFSDTEIDLLGVKIGDNVSVSALYNAPLLLNLIDIVGFVFSNDKVTIRRRNISGASYDAPSMSVNIRVDRL